MAHCIIIHFAFQKAHLKTLAIKIKSTLGLFTMTPYGGHILYSDPHPEGGSSSWNKGQEGVCFHQHFLMYPTRVIAPWRLNRPLGYHHITPSASPHLHCQQSTSRWQHCPRLPASSHCTFKRPWEINHGWNYSVYITLGLRAFSSRRPARTTGGIKSINEASLPGLPLSEACAARQD